MTAETSNARGEWVLVPREPTPEMLVAINWPNDPAGYRAMLAAAPPPADARGDVPYDRELIAQMLDAAEAPAFTMEEMDTQARLLREAAQAKPEARGVVDAKPVGTITRRDSGDEVIEHRIALDPGFEESLYRYPAGTVIHLYAEAAADVALAHVQAAAAALTEALNVR